MVKAPRSVFTPPALEERESHLDLDRRDRRGSPSMSARLSSTGSSAKLAMASSIASMTVIRCRAAIWRRRAWASGRILTGVDVVVGEAVLMLAETLTARL